MPAGQGRRSRSGAADQPPDDDAEDPLAGAPCVHAHLRHWTERARAIPSPELRTQALASIADKTFHCEGGGIYGLLAGQRYREAVRFIVAYQTISDYLDNLCDRSTSLDPDDFRALHASMRH